MSALQHKLKVECGNGRNKAVMINLVNARIEMCKMKASAVQTLVFSPSAPAPAPAKETPAPGKNSGSGRKF